MIRILYVDDNPDDREFISINLPRISGEVRVQSVATATDALTALSTGNHDCVVSDLDMPGMNGLELLRTLRDSGDETPFVFFSTHEFEDLTNILLLAGAQACETKGIGRNQFVRLLNTIRHATRLHCGPKQEKQSVEYEQNDSVKKLSLSTWT